MNDWESRLAAWESELDDAAIWVTLPEAEAEVGVSRSALRSWYRSGEIQSRLLDGPHGPQRLVLLPEVEARAARSPKLLRRAERELSLESEVLLLRTQVQALVDRVDDLERRLPSRT